MDCKDKQTVFQDTLTKIHARLSKDLEAIQSDTEIKAKQIADDFEADNDLAGGVGAAAGTAVGGALGGPLGAVAGHPLGKTIGSLFTLEVTMDRRTVVLDVPQTEMELQDFSFDIPTVVMKDSDISFDIPTPEMRRERGPDLPETRVRMEQRCIDLPFGGKICTDVPVAYIEMVPTYLDLPTIVMKTQHVIVGIPTVEMRRQEVKLELPRIAMKPTEFSFDVPVIIMLFIKDAGKRTASSAAALAQQAQDATTQKQIAFKETMRIEAAPLAIEMFDCFKQSIREERVKVASMFEPEISKLTNAVVALVSQGVPEDDNNRKAVKKELENAISKRDEALKPFDDSLEKLEKSAKDTLEQFIGQTAGSAPQESKGLMKVGPKIGDDEGQLSQSATGLIQFTFPK